MSFDFALALNVLKKQTPFIPHRDLCGVTQVSMVAMVGILVQSFVRFPGFPPFPVDNAARPLAVMKELWASEMTAVILVILVIGIVELTIGRQASQAS